jgi:adenosylhomocysteine nucleosidase
MTETIGLIAAMAMEARPVLLVLGPWTQFTVSGRPLYHLALDGVECVLVESGIGAERAAAASEAILSACSPRYLVSFGIAGAVEPEIHIGDVIVARNAATFEHGALGHIRALACLSKKAYQAVVHAVEAHGIRLFDGTAITTTGPQPPESLLGTWTHPILEMETAAIADVAQKHGTPLLSIRSISDAPEEPIPMAVEDLVDENGTLRVARIAGRLLRHPSMLSRLIRVGRNGARASENAAMVVTTILRDPLNAVGD